VGFYTRSVRRYGAEREQISEERWRSDQRDMRLSQHMIQEHEENGTTWLSVAWEHQGLDRKEYAGLNGDGTKGIRR